MNKQRNMYIFERINYFFIIIIIIIIIIIKLDSIVTYGLVTLLRLRQWCRKYIGSEAILCGSRNGIVMQFNDKHCRTV